MILKKTRKNKKLSDLKGIEASVLGQIMAAQNVLFVLPTSKNIAEFYAKSLSSVPGVNSCRVCLGDCSSQEGSFNNKICNGCENNQRKGPQNSVIPKDFECGLKKLPGFHVFALETIDHRFGFFIIGDDQTGKFEQYKPFISNLANFVALSLENRLQKSDLQKVRDMLEIKVNERTSELQSLNKHLEEEIEEHKRTENALRESEEQFKFLFNTMVQGVVVQDTESKIIAANQAASEILGLSENQLLGKTAYDPRWKLIHEDGSPLYPEEMPSNIALKTCKPVIDILIGAYIPEKNIFHWILTSSTPKFKEGDRKPQLTMTTFTDITSRKQAETNLQEQYSTLHGIINSTNAIVFSVDKQYCYTSFNKKHAEVMKAIYGADIQIGHSMLTYMTVKEDRETAKCNIDAALAGEHIVEESFSGEEHLSRQYFQVSHSPIKKNNSEVIGVAVLVQDMTERRQNEAVNASRLYLIQYSLTHSLDELLEETLNEAEKLTGSLIGFYHFVEDDQKSLTLQNWSTRTKAVFCKAEGKGLHYAIKDAGVWADCVYTRKPIIHNDYATLPNRKGMPEGHATVSRELVVPVMRGEKILAILGVGNKANDYNEKDIETVSLIADLAWEIAERKRTEEALYESQQVFRTLVENSPDIIARYDQNCKRIYVNPVYVMEAQIPHQELLATSPIQLSPLPPSSAIVLQNLIRKVLDTGIAGDADVMWPKADKVDHWYNIYASPEFDREGRVVSVMTISRDITARKQAEEALRESEWRYREIFDNVLDALYLLEVTDDGRFRTIEVNPALERLTGIPRYLSVGKTQEETVPPEVADIVNAKYRNCIEIGHPIDEEVELDLPIGQCYFHSTLIPARNETGKIHRIIGISRDITDRKLAEEEIRRLNQELEQRVKDRTAQLEATNKELEAFAYSVSHDLRAPLRHIEGFMELLAEQTANSLDEKSLLFMNDISDAARHMGTLIDDLLSFSRMGRHEMFTQQVDLGKIVHEVIQEFAPDVADRNIQWHIADLPEVTGDRSLLRAVMVNLIANAIKFTRPREQAEIEIGCQNQNTETIFFIRDNGVGFDPNYADKLFGVFQRLHRSDEFEGTGIGLANVRRIIERHGGRTWAEASVNQGATFYFSLHH